MGVYTLHFLSRCFRGYLAHLILSGFGVELC